MDCHAFLQGIFLTQGLNPCLLYLLHCRQTLPLGYQRSLCFSVLYHCAAHRKLTPHCKSTALQSFLKSISFRQVKSKWLTPSLLPGKAYPRFTRLRRSCLEIMKTTQGHQMLLRVRKLVPDFSRSLPWALLHPQGSLTIPVVLTSRAASPVLQIRSPISLGTRAQKGCDMETQIIWS